MERNNKCFNQVSAHPKVMKGRMIYAK